MICQPGEIVFADIKFEHVATKGPSFNCSLGMYLCSRQEWGSASENWTLRYIDKLDFFHILAAKNTMQNLSTGTTILCVIDERFIFTFKLKSRQLSTEAKRFENFKGRNFVQINSYSKFFSHKNNKNAERIQKVLYECSNSACHQGYA